MVIFAVLFIFIAVIFIQSKIYESFAAKGVEYAISVNINEVFEGDTVEVVEEVSNTMPFPIPWIKTELTVSGWLEFIGTQPDVKSGLRFVPSVFMLWGRRKCIRVWNVKCLKRGVYRFDDIRLYTSDLFGLCSTSSLIQPDIELVVLPCPYELKTLPLNDDLLWGTNPVRRFISDDPFAVSGVREYNDEPMSRIHWASTAKAGSLMVYNTEYTTHNHILYLINFQHGEFGGLSPAPDSYIETAIKAVAWHLNKAKASGIKTTIITNSTQEPEFSGLTTRYSSELECLARLKNECGSSFSLLMETIDIAPYTDIFIFTYFISKNIAKAADRFYRNGMSDGKNTVFYCNANIDDKNNIGYGKIVPLGRTCLKI
ncbi:MAG: DUF58 domain-containing protein [Oscillospiraceae bacterium]|nr:DUF58 domain-containing protein [Oscillospiraceae bacterium]